MSVSWSDYDVYMFDFDGTLCNSQEGITYALSRIFKNHGYDWTQEQLQIFIGPPLKLSIRKHLGLTDEEKISSMVTQYRQFYYEEKAIEKSILYPGMKELVKNLHKKGKKLAIASLKPQKGLEYLTKQFGIDGFFHAICGPNEDEIPSTKEGVIDLVFQQLGTDNRYVLIGDSAFDVAGAHARNVPCIAVHYGFGSDEELKNGDAHAQSVDELADLIL